MVALAGGLWLLPAAGQTTPAVTVTPIPPAASPAHPAATPAPSAGPAASAAAYVDRVLDGSAASNAASDEAQDERPYDLSGWPRQVRVDLRGARERSGGLSRYRGVDLSVFATLDTPNHGLWSLEAHGLRDQRSMPWGSATTTTSGAAATTNGATISDAGAMQSGQSGLLTLRQRQFPLTTALTLDNELGAIGFASPSLAGSNSSRVFAPTHRAVGAQTRWQTDRADQTGWGASASVGEPLQYDGIYAARVRRVGGQVTQLGLAFDHRFDAPGSPIANRQRLRLGVQGVSGRGLGTLGTFAFNSAAFGQTVTVPDHFDSQSLWVGAGLDVAGVEVQANALTSTIEAGQTHRSSGAWLDGSWRNGSLHQSAGAYKLGDGLNWGGLPMSGGLAGFYYRSGWYTRTWLVDGGVDLMRANTNANQLGYYATMTFRRRIDSDLSVGAAVTVRNFHGRATSVVSDLGWRNDWGTSNLRADYTADSDQRRVARATLAHDWAMDNGWTLAQSLSVGRSDSPQTTERSLLGLGLSVLAPLSPSVVVHGTAHAEKNQGALRYGLNVAAKWAFAPRWKLEFGASVDQGRQATVASLDPLAPPSLVASPTLNSQSLSLTLRYELNAGSMGWPLDAKRRSGGGSVGGKVFFDTNRNGVQDPGERGVAGVTVSLNGRYLAQTDELGAFVFPWVVPGKHQVTVLNETLPLPWLAQDDGRREVDVGLRDEVQLSIGVVP